MEKEWSGWRVAWTRTTQDALVNVFGGFNSFYQCFDNLAAHPRRTPGVAKNDLYQYCQADSAFTRPSGLARRSISSDRGHGRVRGAERCHLFDPLVSVDDDYEDCQKLLASCMHPRPVNVGPKERGYRHHALRVEWTRLVWWKGKAVWTLQPCTAQVVVGFMQHVAQKWQLATNPLRHAMFLAVLLLSTSLLYFIAETVAWPEGY